MKPEIRAMLPEFPKTEFLNSNYFIRERHFREWLDKLTEGARVIYGNNSGYSLDPAPAVDTHTALLLCPREIKKQTPLEILTDAVNRARAVYANDDCPLKYMDEILEEALAKIEAAK